MVTVSNIPTAENQGIQQRGTAGVEGAGTQGAVPGGTAVTPGVGLAFMPHFGGGARGNEAGRVLFPNTPAPTVQAAGGTRMAG